jgi:cephalosporin hydroxylase
MLYRLRMAGSKFPEPVKRPAKAVWYAYGKFSARSFSRYFYTRADLTWNNTTWLGVPLWKNPLDLWVYQEIIFEVKPALIIETGTWRGGSAFYFASLLDLIGSGKIVTIDHSAGKGRPEHPRIEYVTGSSVSPEAVDLVRARVADAGGPILIILDSDHRREHVAEELRLLSEFVTPGSYLIVEDTNINGHPVNPFFGPGPMEAVTEVAYLLPWKNHLVAELEALGVPCRCLEVRDERDLRWVGRLRDHVRERRIDIVHAHSPYVAAFSRLVTRSRPARARPRMVTTEHNPWTTFKWPTRIANATTAPLDDATIAVSQETFDSMSQRAQAHTEVLAHGVAVDRIRALTAERAQVRRELGIDDATILVGTVANYHPKKDWPNLLHAARLVADHGAPVRFCAVGQGPLEAEVEALHRELALAGIVTLTGYRADAARLMAGADIFVLASRYEGLPVAVMEACALGLPLVTTAVGGLPERFTDDVDALMVPPGDAAALARAIESVACDPDLRARLARASGLRAADFDVTRAVHRIEAIYDDVSR